MIKSLPTYYKGIEFRSRLEVRWAIFFDALDMPWVYEPEGFDLGDGILYLPDFLVTKHGRKGPVGYDEEGTYWAEVKPVAFTAEQYEKCERLVKGTGRPCLLLVGAPDYRSYPVLEYVPEFSVDEVLEVEVALHSSKNRLWWVPSEDDIRWLSDDSVEYNKAIKASSRSLKTTAKGET